MGLPDSMSNGTADHAESPLLLGCPVWSCDGWSDIVYPAKTPRRDYLNSYSRMFNCVEGNSSFYSTPTPDQARRWASQVRPGFKFCMKFPRVISHDRMLVSAESETRDFLAALNVLAEKDVAGPAFLQLGPEFGPNRFDALRSYLETLPKDLSWAVEVRHLNWFDQAENERTLNALLRDLNIDRCLFDSRPLFQAAPSDEIERISQGRKPKSPVRQTVTGSRPMLRLVGRNDIQLTQPYVQQWCKIVVKWIANGWQPIIFTHAPDDQFAPAFARLFYQTLRQIAGEAGSHWPPLPALPAKPRQLDLL